jgi:hypothetical protein
MGGLRGAQTEQPCGHMKMSTHAHNDWRFNNSHAVCFIAPKLFQNRSNKLANLIQIRLEICINHQDDGRHPTSQAGVVLET